MGKALLLISAHCEKARQRVDQGLSPRQDYLELADILDADVLDCSAVLAHPVGRRVDKFVRRGAGHAWLASRMLAEYDTVFSDGEHIGLLLGIQLGRKRHRARHVMIGHGLSALRKRILAGWARAGIDSLVVHCSSQLEFAIQNLRVDPRQVYLLPYHVDVDFWQPQPGREELLIVSCGMEQRDYETLIEAVRDTPVGLSIAANSHWSKYKIRFRRRRLPTNVTVGSYDYTQLRGLYSSARFVVIPLVEGDYPAGIAVILESMAMSKAVIVTRTRGQTDTVVGPLWSAGQDAWPAEGPFPEDCTGIYVPPGDAQALRSAIVYLLERPELTAVLGGNARVFVEERMSLDRFVQRLATVIEPNYAPQDVAEKRV
jgi:glycosyltransferase involved in cell wall biosynthesis